jgi:hypothetical protein
VAAKPALLAGGNPQIAKADGDAPVQAYIAAMPGWKRDVGRRLDALIVRTVPDVRKAVKWNSPFYGCRPNLMTGTGGGAATQSIAGASQAIRSAMIAVCTAAPSIIGTMIDVIALRQ